MRIQHNIMAMNAYRNYNTNTSALSKNLEKLSSGYKINRAGDDAAGLAISEKMRAQISGLEAAQKNVKDGISLVKTGEGAMQEIQDMLNRMEYLATQSANGTYDNEVDRANLQKEVDALKTEINRIADSANFNGIKLLDGSLDAGGRTTYTEGSFQVQGNGVTVSTGNVSLPGVGETLGTDTVLHKGATDGSDTNEFSVELHNLNYTAGTNTQITLTIGSDKFTLDAADAGGELDAAGIAQAFVDGKFKDSASAAVDKDAVSIGGVNYAVTASNGKLTFTTEEDATIPATVKVEETTAAGNKFTAGNKVTGAKAEATIADLDGTDATGTIDAAMVSKIQGMKITVGGVEVDLKNVALTAGTTKGNEVAAAIETVVKQALADATTAGAAGTDSYSAFDTNATVGIGADGKVTVTYDYTPMEANGAALTGDYNVSTTDITTKAAAADKRLASTHFTLTDDMVTDGSTLTIGTKTYTFTTDKDKIGQEGYVDATSGDLAKIAEKLTDAVAANNTTYTLGTDTTAGHITITEIDGQTDFDLTTKEGIEKSLGFKKASTTPKDDSKSLTLQIGDTSDDFNQMKVSIGDMHTSAMGIASIDIGTQTGAQDAITTIKNAINYVSGVRGDLGAIQNRLEHTGNNLSVMAENIQDAESTIRDTDVAEEMMSYVKNNILVQSAQAMLAQANQVPQGVLQLLG